MFLIFIIISFYLQKVENQNFAGLPPPLPNTPLSFFQGTNRQNQESFPQSPKSNVGQVYPNGQTQFIYHEDISRFGSTNNSRNNNNSHSSRFRFWRSKGNNWGEKVFKMFFFVLYNSNLYKVFCSFIYFILRSFGWCQWL